jgi:hypothetical protein
MTLAPKPTKSSDASGEFGSGREELPTGGRGPAVEQVLITHANGGGTVTEHLTTVHNLASEKN